MDETLTFQSRIGPITVTARDGALIGLHFALEKAQPQDAPRPRARSLLAEARRQIEAYLAGTLQAFSLPLAPAGTQFQRRVFRAMQAIPFGKTATYGELARKLRSSPRAVGGACGRNPLPLIIPCHRVLSKGGIGGYSGEGGLATKRRLLAIEGASLSAQGDVTPGSAPV